MKTKVSFTCTFIDTIRWRDAGHDFLIPNEPTGTGPVEESTELVTLPVLAFVVCVREVEVHTIAH